jgi:uncharacterized protein
MPRYKKGLICLSLIVLLTGGVFVYAKYIEPFALKVEPVTVRSPYVGENADGLRIAVFADTHFGENYTTADFERVLRAIAEQKPDMVFFLGDLIDNYKEYTKTQSPEKISSLLSGIKAPYGKYAVFGNHDYGGGAEQDYGDIMKASGFSVLVNDSVVLDDLGIQLIGIDDMVIGYGDPKTAAAARKDLFNIVLAHEPDIADRILSYDFDLMLSGHTHGRQINVGIFDDYVLPPYGKKYIRGSYELPTARKAELYVNAGIGMTKLPFRFGSAPELTIVTLRREL